MGNLILAVALAFTMGFARTSNAKEKLLITGSSTVAPLMLEISKRFEKENPEIQIDVQTGGSAKGITDQRKGLSSVGMISRSLRSDEDDLHEHTIAKDGIAIIVHKDVPIGELDRRTIIKIYKGDIKKWSEIGGPNVKFNVVHKADGGSTQELFLKHFSLKSGQVKPSVIVGDNELGIKTVSTNPASIGYVSIGAAKYSVEQGVPIKLLRLGGVKATTRNVRNGKFPLSRELNLITKEKPKGSVKKLIEFAKSEKVKDLIEKFYFVPAN